jgi:ElaB/YqjD/DUF883 family membrane-anchored ribosome-binding protein
MAQAYQSYDKQRDPATAVKDQIDRASGQVERLASAASHQAQEVGENMKTVASNVDSAVRSSIRDQPMTTLAVAAAVGFVLGAIWKS